MNQSTTFAVEPIDPYQVRLNNCYHALSKMIDPSWEGASHKAVHKIMVKLIKLSETKEFIQRFREAGERLRKVALWLHEVVWKKRFSKQFTGRRKVVWYVRMDALIPVYRKLREIIM